MERRPQPKYRPFPAVELADRRWPGRVATRAPIWMSTDLRDGNQALFEPMSVAKKLRLFETLCAVGFKEIEVGVPLGLADRFRLRAPPHRGRPASRTT